MSVVMASLLAGHWLTLPRPDRDDERLRAGLASLAAPEPTRQWRLHHVLYSECGCSRRVLEHVATRARAEQAGEIVLLVGEDPEVERLCRERGLRIESLDEAELEARFGVSAAPLLVITDPQGRTRYCGGYTDRKRGIAFQDLDLLARLRAGEDVAPLPVYGCGVAADLQQALDPLGLKY